MTAVTTDVWPQPLAAYRLGLLSRIVRMERDNFLLFPDFQWGTALGVWLSYTELREAVLTLAAEVPQNVFGELLPLLCERQSCWARILNMVYESDEEN